MSESAQVSSGPAMSQEGVVQRFLRATELDARMLGMIGALILIWIGFDIYSGILRPSDGLLGGTFLTPRNLWTLLVQTSSIAVMTTGMVLIIVMRHIDLSVGSILAFVAVMIGTAQVFWMPQMGFPVGHPAIWIVTLIGGLVLGAAIGAFHGTLIAYAGIPAFIVTLGGLIFWRGAAWAVIRGETVAPMDKTFKLLGGGPFGAVGSTWSWAIGLATCAAIVAAIMNGRTQRRRFNFPLRPVWAETFLAVVGCAVTLGAVLVVNAYLWPKGVVDRWAAEKGITVPPEGLEISHGFAVPVLIAAGIAITMTFVATRTRFGRYIYATGGNPEAAELAGINTRKMTVGIFTVMGMLAAISASISTARLDAASNALGTFDELYVIAAAVIGGTSLAGGIGTIYGAIIGALLMQSLQSGMTLLNFESATKDMVVGAVLVLAVWLDQIYRRNVK